MLNTSFRSTYGLDAAGESVINVKTPSETDLFHGANVDFVIDKNTIQHYNPDRGYKKDFAVLYNNRLYVATRDIDSPAGVFNESYWTSVRVDPKFSTVTQTVTDGTTLIEGDYIAADSTDNELLFVLPSNPADGTTISLKDIGGAVGFKHIKIKKSVHQIFWNSTEISEFTLTRPYSQVYFIFARKIWRAYQVEHESIGRILTTSKNKQKISAGEKIYRKSATGEISVELPKYAVQGDVIEFYDIDQLTPVNHLFVYTSENSGHSIGILGQTKNEFKTSGTGRLIFNEANKLWVVWEGDLRSRLKIVKEDYKIKANESILVVGTNNTTKETIKVSLPESVEVGDSVEIILTYIRKGQTVKILSSGTDKIATEKKLLQFPKRSEYPPAATWVEVTELEFNGDTDYVPYIKLAYTRSSGEKGWIVQSAIPTVERVDSSNRQRIGLIGLASQEQANVDKTKNPEKELAITPETLANRTSTVERQGIARLATKEEVVQDTGFNFLDDVIVTPKTFSEKTATETRTGISELATQDETNKGTDDFRIVTPKKLNDRKASETLTGIAKIVSSKGTAGTQRDKPGSGVYDFTNNTDIVTPAASHEHKSTETAQGQVYLATETEVIEAPKMDPLFPVVVTPVQLHKKTATETRIGFSELATQDETNKGTDDFRIVTPKKLNDRKASETLTGITSIATQTEFNEGTNNSVIVTPKKLKDHFNSVRTLVTSESGLVESGTLWTQYKLDIKAASESQRGTLKLSTQDQVNKGLDDTTAVTPAKLQAKQASEEVFGIIRVSTYDETIKGVNSSTAISPVNFVKAIRTESNGLESTTVNRGFVRIPENASVWQGSDETGSNGTYEHNGFAVSPRELNKALSHYLPIKGTAVNSTKFDKLSTTDFIRRNIPQTIVAKMTFNEEVDLNKALTSSSTGKFVSTDVNVSNIGNGTTATINMKSSTPWKIESSDSLKFNGIEFNKANGIKSETSTVNDYFSGSSYRIKDLKIIDQNDTLNFGNSTVQLNFESKNPDTVKIGSSTILTTGNIQSHGKLKFIERSGDSVEGQIEFKKPVKIPYNEIVADTPPVDGYFTAKITKKAVYETYPGIAVPVIGKDNLVTDYTYVKGPGMLSQVASGNGFVLQTWVPQALGTEDNHNNYTMWTRVYNPIKKAWDQFGRVYTSNNPPTASEIGAVSTAGSTFETLTINEWLQVGPVRLVPNLKTKTVDFVWVE